ncbi:MAG: hypothetical protein KY476_08035 [Planctomycetes bacterium]|nr:hypothetical protein [Planctomycetota bacterium]
MLIVIPRWEIAVEGAIAGVDSLSRWAAGASGEISLWLGIFHRQCAPSFSQMATASKGGGIRPSHFHAGRSKTGDESMLRSSTQTMFNKMWPFTQLRPRPRLRAEISFSF